MIVLYFIVFSKPCIVHMIATNNVEKAIAEYNTVKTHNIAITSSSTQYTGDLHLPRPMSLDEPYDWKYCRLLATAAGKY